MMPLICMEQVPPAEMRYADVGDWHFSHKGLEIRVPRGLSDDETLLIMVHELVEAYAARTAGLTEDDASRWDVAHHDAESPGDLSRAPYHHQHAMANKVERKLEAVLHVDDAAYQADVDRVYDTVQAALHAPN
jgi:hypothetical protein